jgi:phosphatidylglycerol:prolipoprotein diacylglycerol transferase
MHPILFRIPLPKYPLPLTWLFLAAAAVALVIALVALARKNREGAAIPGVIAVACAGVGLYMRGRVWEMGPIPIYSYGIMLGLSLVVGWYLTLGLAERDGLPKETMANNYVVTALAAVVGSRVLYILTNLNEFDSLDKVFAMRQGGLVAYGGFIGGYLGSFFFLRRHKIPLLPWADVAVPSLASGLMITRIGCYLFGCDFGKPLQETAPRFLKTLGTFPHWPDGTLDNGTGSPAWAQHVKAHLIDPSAPSSLPVHPTQIYESLVGAGLLVLLLSARKHQKFRGQIFLLFFFAYGVCRYGLEVLRADVERGEIPPSLPEHILIPLGALILATGYVIGFSKAIKNPIVRRVTQLFAFVPSILLFFALKPVDFDNNIQFSTSQFIAVTTGFAASIAFSVFLKAAEAHPESAMALGLPPEAFGPHAEKTGTDEDDEDDDEDDEDEAPAPKKPAKPAAKQAEKAAASPSKAKPRTGNAPPADQKRTPSDDEASDEEEER